MSVIKIAVFPVAGMGTRFLPVTKAHPKEMLPIVDKPLIQYVVEEAIAAGITQLVFVTSAGKGAIEDYFDSNYELESRLEARGKYDVLSVVKNIVPDNVNLVYVRQPHPLGLGDAVLRAKGVVGNEPFAVLLADDIMEHGHEACLQQMVSMYESSASSVLAVEEIPQSDTDKYGIISVEDDSAENLTVTSIVEKPAPSVAPSTLAVTGRYILTPRIFDWLENTKSGVGGEVQLTDAIAKLMEHELVLASRIEGRRFDCGSRMGFLEATLHFALKRPELKDRLQKHLLSLTQHSDSPQ